MKQSVRIEISISTAKWFESQRQCAKWLGIKNSSRDSIVARCNKLGYQADFF